MTFKKKRPEEEVSEDVESAHQNVKIQQNSWFHQPFSYLNETDRSMISTNTKHSIIEIPWFDKWSIEPIKFHFPGFES